MGKGDRKTRRGKLFKGSYGVRRPGKKVKQFRTVSGYSPKTGTSPGPRAVATKPGASETGSGPDMKQEPEVKIKETQAQETAAQAAAEEVKAQDQEKVVEQPTAAKAEPAEAKAPDKKLPEPKRDEKKEPGSKTAEAKADVSKPAAKKPKAAAKASKSDKPVAGKKDSKG